MKHSETVRQLPAKNAHWRYYDENFRSLQQKKTLFPWDQIHWELWLQVYYMNKTAPAVSSESSHKKYRQLFPTGFCRKFHRGDKCSGCNFKHECFKCGNRHPANQCTFLSRQQSNPKNASRSAGTFTSKKHQLKLINYSFIMRDTRLALSNILLTAFPLVFPFIMLDLVTIFHLKMLYLPLPILRPLAPNLTKFLT